jgi:sec-independent protein translocase protein TatA
MIHSIILGIVGAPEIIIILIVVLLLFGGKKIPELMKGFGQGIREFKAGMNAPDVKKPEEQEETKKK